MNTPHFYIALFIHLISLIIGFGAVIVIDTFGFLLLINKQPLSMPKKVANITQVLIWVGWTGLVISGINLIVLKGYLDSLTLIKLFFVLLLGLNGIFLHVIKKALDKFKTFNDVPKLWRFRIGLASLISQTGWWAAIFIGFIHRHINHSINWPENPLTWLFGLSLIFIFIILIGEILFKKK
jgi:hypothetical protein